MLMIMQNVKANFMSTAGYNEEILSARGTAVHSSGPEGPFAGRLGKEVSIASELHDPTSPWRVSSHLLGGELGSVHHHAPVRMRSAWSGSAWHAS
jgi:hypothetical protein